MLKLPLLTYTDARVGRGKGVGGGGLLLLLVLVVVEGGDRGMKFLEAWPNMFL